MKRFNLILFFFVLMLNFSISKVDAALETVRVSASGYPQENMPFSVVFFDNALPNNPIGCSSGGYVTYNSNVIVERISPSPFLQRALYNSNCAGGIAPYADAMADINPGDQLRVTLANLPAGTVCTNWYGEFTHLAPIFFKQSLPGGTGCVANIDYSDSSLFPTFFQDGGLISVNFEIEPEISPIQNFVAQSRDLGTESGPGINISWTDAIAERGYLLLWRNNITGVTGQVVLTSNTTNYAFLENYSVPLASRNPICDGTPYTFTLEAYTSYMRRTSNSVVSSCSRGYIDLSTQSRFGVFSANGNNSNAYTNLNLQSDIRDAFDSLADPRLPGVLPIQVPIYIPNATGTTTVMGTISITTRVRYGGASTDPNVLAGSEEYVITTVNANSNQQIYIPWPGIRTSNESVQLDVTIQIQNIRDDGPVIQSISTINTNDPWNSSTGVIFTSPTAPPSSPPNLPPADGLVPNDEAVDRSRTQIGSLGIGVGTFRDVAVVTAGKSYDMKVAISGTTSNASVLSTLPKATMLVMDVTGSMQSTVVFNGVSMSRLNAAKEALKSVVDMATPDSYLGLSAFVVCEGNWNANLYPELVWSYERANPSLGNRVSSNGVIMKSMSLMTSSEKDSLKSLIDRLALDSKPQINLCSGNTPGFATDFGGGLTAALAEHLRHSYTGSIASNPFTLSRNFSDGISRTLSNNVLNNVSKYIVFASDGDQNMFPKSTDPDIFPSGTNSVTPIDNATSAQIPIYTISMGAPASEAALKFISDQTGGKFVATYTGDELVSSFETIYRDIQSSSSYTTISYALNTTDFEFGNASNARVTILRAGSTELPLSNCSTSNISTPDCVINNAAGTISVKAPIIRARDRIYLYFKAAAKTVTEQTLPIPVNRDPNARVVFNNVSPADEYQLDNVSVIIIPQDGFFKTEYGNVYSSKGIVSYIPDEVPPSERFFATDEEPVVFVGDPSAAGFKLQLGAGAINPNQWVVRNYDVLHNQLLNYLKINDSTAEVIDSSQPNNSLWVNGAKELYLYQNESGTLVLPDSNVPVRHNKVIISEGEVFIDGNIEVEPGNVVIINAKGGIKIGNNVSQVSGIFITNERISTYCSRTTLSCQKEPVVSTDPPLVLEGMYIAQQGFQLGRRGKVSLSPPIAGETFIMRPDFLLYGTKYLGEQRVIFSEIAD